MYIKERYELAPGVKEELFEMTPDFGYGVFSEVVLYRTYARTKDDGSVESWADIVIRCIEGCLSIRKDWYLKNHIAWDQEFWDVYARNMAISLFHMHWSPGGRGLWAMGTDFIYARGSLALNNCAYIDISNDVGKDAHWVMDALMCGAGVGFSPLRLGDIETYAPTMSITVIIPDTREGWCDSIKLQIDSYLFGTPKPKFDYDSIRPAGLPIKGFGGISSGPEPLRILHGRIDNYFRMYRECSWYDEVLLKADIINAIGCCVVAGNVRRSAEIACGSIHDQVFMDLKNYDKYPHRAEIGWMSNNSCYLECDEDYEILGEIAQRVIANGEPGIINLQNLPKGRVGKKMKGLKKDKAVGFNPCGEQPLESGEFCNLAETFPTRCDTIEQWHKGCEYATVYACSVSLLPTHRPESNAVIARNRRIGVGLVDFSGWKHGIGLNKVIKHLRNGYKTIRRTAQWISAEAGVPEPIRVTTVKPGGTVPKVAGRTAGLGHPNFIYTLRRMRLAQNSPMFQLLVDAGVPHEPDVYSMGTEVFEFPILQGPAKPAFEVSLREQAMNLVVLQREWSDNAVSNTLNFKPKWIKMYEFDESSEKMCEEISERVNRNINLILTSMNSYVDSRYKIERKYKSILVFRYNPQHEEDEIEPVLAAIAPHIKSVSLLPQTEEGVYRQMPEQGITAAEYERRTAQIKHIDWSLLKQEVASPELYCTSEKCELPQ